MQKPQFYTKIKYSFAECMLNFITTVMIAELFVGANQLLMGELYGGWELSPGVKVLLQVLIIGLIFVNEFLINAMPKGQNLVRLLLEVMLFLVAGIYIFVHWAKVLESGQDFVDLLYRFSKDSVKIQAPSDEYSLVVALGVIIITVLALTISFITKHQGGLLVIPILGITLNMLANRKFPTLPVVLIFVGVFLCSSGGWSQQDISLRKVFLGKSGRTKDFIHRILIRVACALGALVILGASSVLFSGVGEKMIGRKAEVQRYQKEKASQISQSVNSKVDNIVSSVTGNSLKGESADVLSNQLGNGTPEYDDVQLFTVYLQNKPNQAMYLKNSMTNVYDNGSWTFRVSYGEEGADLIEKSLLEEIYSRMSQSYGEETSELWRRLYVQYGTRAVSGTYYAPYTVNMNEIMDEAYLTNRFTLACIDKEMAGCNYSYYDTGALDYDGLMRFMNSIGYVNYSYMGSESLDYYNNSFVENYYLNVGNAQNAISSFANEIRQMPEYKAVAGYANTDDSKRRNEYRCVVAGLIQSRFSEYSYSLKLDKLPKGTDPVDYFLNTSHEGYCMHYATAGTLILRELGIPARYCCGYIVKSSDFEENSDGIFVADVLDSNAHAWTEVYMENIGWIPVEMTKGYSSSELITEQASPDSETQVQTESETQTQIPPEDTQTESETDSSDSQQTTEETVADDTPVKKMSAGTKILLTVVMVLLVVAGIAGVIAYLVQRDRQKLLMELRKKRNTAAVKHMNRVIYRRLRLRGKGIGQHLSDNDYEKLLAQTYTDISPEDWKHYMEILKKAVFSRNEITTEEVGFVRSVMNHQMKKKKKG